MTASDDAALAELAEATTLYDSVGAGEDRVVDDRFVLFLGRRSDASANIVQRLRLTQATVAATVDEVRERARRHGARGLTWEIATGATPLTLQPDLHRLGLHAGEPAVAVSMGTRRTPPAGPGGIEVTPVDSLEGFRDFVSVSHEGLDRLQLPPVEMERIDREGSEHLADPRFVRYVARSDGVPVGAATATFTNSGVILHSGFALPEPAAPTVYRALVRARWDDAVRRGTPALVARARSLSRPILTGLGFRDLGEIHFLVDDLEALGDEAV